MAYTSYVRTARSTSGCELLSNLYLTYGIYINVGIDRQEVVL